MYLPILALVYFPKRADRHGSSLDDLCDGIAHRLEFDTLFSGRRHSTGELVHFFVCEYEEAGVCHQKSVHAEDRCTFITVTKNMTARDVDEEIGCFGRKRRVQLLAKAFLVRLFRCRMKKIEV